MTTSATTARPNFVKRLAQTRKGRVLLVLGVLMLTAGLTAAAAAFFGLAKVAGGGSNGKFAAKLDYVASSFPVMAGSDASTTSPTKNADGSVALPADLEFFPGMSYGFQARADVDGTRNGYISGVQFSGLPAGYTAELTAGCGTYIDSAATGSTNPLVGIKITATDAAAADGAKWTLAPSAGLIVTPLPKGTTAAPAGVTCPAFTVPAP